MYLRSTVCNRPLNQEEIRRFIKVDWEEVGGSSSTNHYSCQCPHCFQVIGKALCFWLCAARCWEGCSACFFWSWGSPLIWSRDGRPRKAAGFEVIKNTSFGRKNRIRRKSLRRRKTMQFKSWFCIKAVSCLSEKTATTKKKKQPTNKKPKQKNINKKKP